MIKLFPVIRKMDFYRAEPTCGAFSYIVLCVMRLTYTRGLIQFSNSAKLSRLMVTGPKHNVRSKNDSFDDPQNILGIQGVFQKQTI